MPLHLDPGYRSTDPDGVILELIQIRDLVHLDVALSADFTLVLSNRRDLPAWSYITGMAVGEEPRTYDQPEPCIGEGLTAVAQQAIADANQYKQFPVKHLSHDYNGEPYRADEYGFTSLRLSDQLEPDLTRHTPALVSGDLGAASVITHTALAAWGSQQHPDGTDHLILASSDDPLRGALVLHGRERNTA